jgi:hypothetical protein
MEMEDSAVTMPEDNGGTTPSERYLARLATKTFLTPWSYPNLYTDEGRANGRGDGKELCDLLVIFGDHVLIFSDKHCEFPTGPSLAVAWARWYRRAVEKSVRQILGARSWIMRFPDRVFLDRACQSKTPLKISALPRFHLIAVTRGAYDACKAFFSGQSTGSLMINTSVVGTGHQKHPFTIGRVVADGPLIHVFDELTLNVVLRELDTIQDLVDYFSRKEEFLSKPDRAVMAAGEEQLVAMYLTRMDDQGRHNFAGIPEDLSAIYIDEGHWEAFVRNPQYLAKKQADKDSYAWDRLIEHLARRGEFGLGEGRRHDLTAMEPALRVLASETRLARRQLGRQLLGAMKKKVPPGSRFLRVGYSSPQAQTAYVFLILPPPPEIETYEKYREARAGLLFACCKVARLRATSAIRVVGIATEPAGTKGGSEDLVLLDYEKNPWDASQEAEARQLQKELGILGDKTAQYKEYQDTEYPEVREDQRDLARLSPAQRLIERERLRRVGKLKERSHRRK